MSSRRFTALSSPLKRMRAAAAGYSDNARRWTLFETAPNQIDLLIEMSFHPLNTFVAVPSYQVEVIARGRSTHRAAAARSIPAVRAAGGFDRSQRCRRRTPLPSSARASRSSEGR